MKYGSFWISSLFKNYLEEPYLHWYAQMKHKYLQIWRTIKYTYKNWEKSKVRNKSQGASNFLKKGYHYTDVVDVDAICGGAAAAGVCMNVCFPGFFSVFQGGWIWFLALLCLTFCQKTFPVK